MRVYRVSPVVQYSPFFMLTYFSKLDFIVGNICEIDFNKRKIPAVVVEVLEMNDAKVEIRSSNFKTKKIESKLDHAQENFFSKKQFKIIQEFADKFLLPVGEVVYALVGDEFEEHSIDCKKFSITKLEIFSDKLSSQQSGYSGQEVFETLETIRKQKKLNDLKEIVVNDFQIDKYIQYQAPHLSLLHLLTLYIQVFTVKSRLTFNTVFLGVAEKCFLDELDVKYKLVEESDKAKRFIYNKSKKTFSDDENVNNQERVLDDAILDVLKENNKKKAKTFVFVLSHGYQSSIFCKDCKSGYGCQNCGQNYSILVEQDADSGDESTEKFKRYLYCKNCEHKKALKKDEYLICKECGSWGLFPYGEGTQKIFEELGGDCTFIDESTKKLSDKKLYQEVTDFLSSKQQHVLLGTKRVLKVLRSLSSHMNADFDKLETIVVSLGPIASGSSFDADENFIKLLSELESVSEKIYIGKKDNESAVLDRYKNKEKYIKEELNLRKRFNLPPFTSIVSLSFDKRLKYAVDKYLKDFEKLGEKLNNNKLIYHLNLSKQEVEKNRFLLEGLRQFGELVVSSSMYESFIKRR